MSLYLNWHRIRKGKSWIYFLFSKTYFSIYNLKGHVEKYLSKEDYVIQIWTTGKDEVIRELLDKDYKVIFSNYDAWYMDCGYAGWVTDGNNWCAPWKGWQAVYDNSPRQMYRDLGGERSKGMGG